MSTAQLANLSQPGQDLYGIQFTNNGQDRYFSAAARCLRQTGHIVGALGVSGGTAEEDTAMRLTEKKSLRRY